MTYFATECYVPAFSDFRGMYGVGEVPRAENLTMTKDGAHPRKSGEWTNKRKGVKVYGPEGQIVTYRNHRQIEKADSQKWNAFRDASR